MIRFRSFASPEAPMISKKNIKNKEIAILDRDRKGIFIHKDQLSGSSFKVGDRFSIKIGGNNI
jgi:hypothetical protein